ncbi:hypothetical protein TSAR_009626 [Trichomalopsis sarcophagae]|uniref:DBF4-type domain-containing protein n=1 Tax=Trichomalopsis sarcophagae TaxID=543379 RepID=A0A232F1H3_9HYME|nr:hypothetical protein TSAR_009626 [Trichomalopsis sarcophagae]
MLERALTQPQQCSVDPLNNAQTWGIPIWTSCQLLTWLEKISASLKDTTSLRRDSHAGSGKDLKVKQLTEPYIKFESYKRETRPVFLELQAWPTLNFDGDPGSCPFDLKRREKKEVSINKEIKENREKYFNPNLSKGKDMTRRPRATTTRARKTENTGYCEICRIDYRNLSKHLQSDQHLNFVRNDKNFLSLDNLISTGASVEAFLKINRSKDVSKACNLFASRDHSLENGILSADEKPEKKDKSSLNEFGIDDMKMIQCNGARRNLNLDSHHNLRTRAKHESGHLLRSKGKPSDEVEKSEKSCEKFIIKKRAKGILWIEENDSEEEKCMENEQECGDKKPLLDRLCETEANKAVDDGENTPENVSVNGDVDPDTADCKRKESSPTKVITKDNVLRDSLLEVNSKIKVNGYEKREEKRKVSEVLNSADNNETKEVNHVEPTVDSIDCNSVDTVNNTEKPSLFDNEDTNSLKSVSRDDRGKIRSSRRGGRTYKGRQRLSVEERLIEDNREYYKVEVLGNKLRSSAIPSSNVCVSPSKQEEADKAKKDDKPSSEKPVVVRFKRVRKSELSLLSDEAEMFMFGDSRRDDESSEASDGEQSSVLPQDTESDGVEIVNSFVVSSSPANASIKIEKQELTEDESQDSCSGRAKKRRRTQTEALIKDNTDYYKFETPGSRLRYQAPLTGISELVPEKDEAQSQDPAATPAVVEKVYPSKPSPEVEKMHFSFEAVPKSEPWYQTYQRQDEGAEYYHFFSEVEKPFLLPYEIEDFHEIIHRTIQNSMKKRGRSRGGHVNLGTRSPRKSPRCHASTLAIMSTIIKRREQTTNLSTIEEEKPKVNETSKSEKKSSEKSDVDEDLKEIVKNLDEMLSSNDMQDMDSFEVDLLKNAEDVIVPEVPKGAPVNLIELLDQCHDAVPNGIENSSCASSECGELNVESPAKRRKKRKNKTGWPGNKMRRKLHIKNLSEELQKELDLEKRAAEEVGNRSVTDAEITEDGTSSQLSHDEEGNETEHETGKENEQLLNTIEGSKPSKSRKTKSKECKEFKEPPQDLSELKESEEAQDKTVLKSVCADEISTRKKRSASSDKCKVESEEEESHSQELTDRGGPLSSISEDSEESMSNNENVCTKDANSLIPLEKNSPLKFCRKRKRNNTTSSEASHHTEIENRRSGVGSSPKKQQKDSSDNTQDLPLSSRKNSRKRSKKNRRTPSKVVLEGENCKKESFLSASERKRLKKAQRNDSVSSELRNGEMDPALSERISPTLVASSDVDQRRSSIDFQPVVRVMKIEDQVDMDSNSGSMLSVAVASNRRLRSSSSPRSSMQPPAKRFRNGANRRQFSGQLIKNS